MDRWTNTERKTVGLTDEQTDRQTDLPVLDPGRETSQSASPFPAFHFLTKRPPPFTVTSTEENIVNVTERYKCNRML